MSDAKTANRIAGGSLAVSIIALLIATAGPWAYQNFYATSGTIVSPAENLSTRSTAFVFEGTIARPPHPDQDIWLVTRPETLGRWFPIERIRITDAGGWSTDVDVDLGEPAKYRAFLFLTDSSASAELENYKMANLEVVEPPGLDRMPEGAEFLTSNRSEIVP